MLFFFKDQLINPLDCKLWGLDGFVMKSDLFQENINSLFEMGSR